MSTQIQPVLALNATQQEQLVHMGYLNPKLNARIFLRTGGDFSKLAKILEKKKLKQSQKAKVSSPAPLEEASNALISMGFANKKRNLRILTRTNGNVEEAAAILKKAKEKKASSTKCKISTDPSSLEEGANTLLSMGFANKKQNLRVLARTNGNVEEAAMIIQKAAEKKRLRGTPTLKVSKKVDMAVVSTPAASLENGQETKPAPEEETIEKESLSTMEAQLEQLRSAGFTRDEHKKMLARTGGNVEVVLQFLRSKAKLHQAIQQVKIERKNRLQAEKERTKALRRQSKVKPVSVDA